MRRYLPHVLGGAIVAALIAAIAFASMQPDPDTDVGPDITENGEVVHGLTPSQAAEVAARVGEREITVGEVADELARNNAFVRTRYNSPERRREFLDQMIRFELLAQEAERRGYDELPEVQRAEKQLLIRHFLEERFEEDGPESIPEADVRAYYDAHPSDYHTPEQVRASHILIPDRATAQRVLEQVRAAESDLRLYRQLAEQHNTDAATRDRFGDLRFFSRPGEEIDTDPDVPAAVREAAFSIERIGGVHPTLVQTPEGFHIVKLTGRRAAMNRTYEASERAIRNRLWRERQEAAIEALVNELRAEADVEENLELLDHQGFERQEAAIEALVNELRAEADVEENLELLDQLHLEIGEDRSPIVDTPGLSPAPSPVLPPGVTP